MMSGTDRFAWILLAVLGACAVPPVDDPEPADSFPTFEEDCGSARNDSIDTASGLTAEDGWERAGLRLCSDDVDVYRIDVPPGAWASVRIDIDGDGSGSDDLDLFELSADGDELWWSATEFAWERLAFYNPGSEPAPHYLQVVGYSGAHADYSLIVRTSPWHDTAMDCDEVYPDNEPDDEDGECNRVLAFPTPGDADDGWFVEHPAMYSNLRREVQYLVQYATREVYRQFPGTNPLATLDQSEPDGSTPGTAEGSLRHPDGTHVDGNDIDIAYYSTADDNGGRIVCPEHSAYYCTGPATLLDVDRATYFLAKLFNGAHVRVIGTDPEVAELVEGRSWEMEDEGLITTEERGYINSGLAYGDGWPFHHHHFHLSWDWEGGWGEERAVTTPGCLTEAGRAAYPQ